MIRRFPQEHPERMHKALCANVACARRGTRRKNKVIAISQRRRQQQQTLVDALCAAHSQAKPAR